MTATLSCLSKPGSMYRLKACLSRPTETRLRTHVDMGDSRPQGCHPLPLAEVTVHLQGLLALLLSQIQVHSQVLEVANEGACSMGSGPLQHQRITESIVCDSGACSHRWWCLQHGSPQCVSASAMPAHK